jgi:hypothetical protein
MKARLVPAAVRTLETPNSISGLMPPSRRTPGLVQLDHCGTKRVVLLFSWLTTVKLELLLKTMRTPSQAPEPAIK